MSDTGQGSGERAHRMRSCPEDLTTQCQRKKSELLRQAAVGKAVRSAPGTVEPTVRTPDLVLQPLRLRKGLLAEVTSHQEPSESRR